MPIVAAHFGWRASFIFTGSLDVVWLIAWLSFYRKPSEHKLLTEQERRLIESDSEGETPAQVPYSKVISKRPAWGKI